jgi:hypothetical protein
MRSSGFSFELRKTAALASTNFGFFQPYSAQLYRLATFAEHYFQNRRTLASSASSSQCIEHDNELYG